MAEIQRKGAKKKSQGAVVWDAVLTGISYMIPFIVGGGVLEGIAKAMGGYNIAADMAATAGYSEYTLAMVIYAIGAAIFDVCVPIIGAYIGYALADKPGLAPGFAVGVVSNTIKAGFLGAVLGGIIAGYVVNFLKEASKKVPSDVSSVFPILLIPVLGTVITSLLMWYVIGVPVSWFMSLITSTLTNLQGAGGLVFGAAIGMGMSIDRSARPSLWLPTASTPTASSGLLPARCAAVCRTRSASASPRSSTALPARRSLPPRSVRPPFPASCSPAATSRSTSSRSWSRTPGAASFPA